MKEIMKNENQRNESEKNEERKAENNVIMKCGESEIM
jgi:hypothetical protein